MEGANDDCILLPLTSNLCLGVTVGWGWQQFDKGEAPNDSF